MINIREIKKTPKYDQPKVLQEMIMNKRIVTKELFRYFIQNTEITKTILDNGYLLTQEEFNKYYKHIDIKYGLQNNLKLTEDHLFMYFRNNISDDITDNYIIKAIEDPKLLNRFIDKYNDLFRYGLIWNMRFRDFFKNRNIQQNKINNILHPIRYITQNKEKKVISVKRIRDQYINKYKILEVKIKELLDKYQDIDDEDIPNNDLLLIDKCSVECDIIQFVLEKTDEELWNYVKKIIKID